MATRRSGRDPSTKILRDPGIGRVTDSESCCACCCRGEGTAFIGIVLWVPREAPACWTKRRRSSPTGTGGAVAKLPYGGINRIRFEGSVSTTPCRPWYPRFGRNWSMQAGERPEPAFSAARRREPQAAGWDNPDMSPDHRQARAFAPASVGNIGVGFDLLGHVIDGPRDVATVRVIEEPVVRVDAVRGPVRGIEGIPLDAAANTAGRALITLREGLGLGHGFAIELDKGIPMGSGLGGSAASCVAALVAANALLAQPLSR